MIDEVFKQFYCIHEAVVSHDDKHINWIEVFLAVETPGQICFMVGGGMKNEAKRASEPEYLVFVSHLKIQQIDNNIIDEDVIT